MASNQQGDKLTGKQKAAIFLVTLGADISSNIFKHLTDKEIEELTLEIAKLEKVEPSDKDSVVQEFHEMLMANDFITQGGLDYARQVLEKALGTQRSMDIINRLTQSIQVKPFDFVRKADPSHVLNFIQGEHPQTISLILSYLDPDTAAAILPQLNVEIQADVAKRIATMDRTSPEILRQVERVLEKKLSSLVSEEYTIAGGVQAIVDILNKVDRGTEKSILENLEEEEPELAEEIKKLMFVFEDIVLLDDRSIQQVLREVDTKELAVALKAVDETVKQKIFGNMSKRASAMLEEDMEFMGPVRMRDVEEAQQRIVNVIRRLEESGDIIIARGGEEELVV
ncbi:flagellar motor switch protein FliG [Candidatus Dependentiae bacterium]|nr:flagellar motor switch protein FliG [Candidatus Dependentiae bacterium]